MHCNCSLLFRRFVFVCYCLACEWCYDKVVLFTALGIWPMEESYRVQCRTWKCCSRHGRLLDLALTWSSHKPHGYISVCLHLGPGLYLRQCVSRGVWYCMMLCDDGLLSQVDVIALSRMSDGSGVGLWEHGVGLPGTLTIDTVARKTWPWLTTCPPYYTL